MHFSLLAISLLFGVVCSQHAPGWQIDLNGQYYTPIFRNPVNVAPAENVIPPGIHPRGKCFHKNKLITNFSHLQTDDIVLCYYKTIKEIANGQYAIIDTETVYKIVSKPSDIPEAFFQHFMSHIGETAPEKLYFRNPPNPNFDFLPAAQFFNDFTNSIFPDRPNPIKTLGVLDLIGNKINAMFQNGRMHCVHDNKKISSLDMATPKMLRKGIECKIHFNHLLPFGDNLKTYFMTEGNLKIIVKTNQGDNDFSLRGLQATTAKPKDKDEKLVSTTAKPIKGYKYKDGKVVKTTKKPKKVDHTTTTTIKPIKAKPKKLDKISTTTIKPKKAYKYKDGKIVEITKKPKKLDNISTTTIKPKKAYKYKDGKIVKTTTKLPGKDMNSTTTAKPKRSYKNSDLEWLPMHGDDRYKGLRDGMFQDLQSSIKDKWHKLTDALSRLRKHNSNLTPSQ